MFSWQLVFICDSRSSKLNSEEPTRFHDIQVKLGQRLINLLYATLSAEKLSNFCEMLQHAVLIKNVSNLSNNAQYL